MTRRHTAVDGLELALCFTFVLDTNGAASAGRVGGHYGGFVWGLRLKVGGCLWYGCSRTEAMDSFME